MTNSKFNIFINKKTISVNDRAFNYGDGLFETILVKNNKIIYLKEHVKRLHKGCDIIFINKPTFSLIKKNAEIAIGNRKNCILKIILSRGSCDFGYQYPKDLIPNLYFIRTSISSDKGNTTERVDVAYANYKPLGNNNLSKIKHLNRLDQCLIANELQNIKNGYNDLVITQNKNIIETLSSNLFFTKEIKKQYFFDTPLISDFGIKGVMREKIIQFLRKKGYKVNIKNIEVSNVKKYTSCFKVNSVKGIIFIDRIGKNKFSKPEILYNILKSFIY
ncbi:MAG: aminotransferase class IV [Gammaproteobacteria bacterium]|nr:aminotransferase class IV [Gammaproteobacteria bacterium]